MNQALDFIVSGVPRSGTSAFARSLNLHPKLFCGIECFPITYDYAGFAAPQSFLALADADTRTRAQDNSLEALNNKLATSRPPVQYGNKLPRYYFCLWRLQRENMQPQILHLYRDPIATAQSWDRRAANPKDSLWQRGQIGLFAVAECFIALLRLAQLDQPICLISHTRYFSTDPNDYARVLKVLGVRPDKTAAGAFRAEYFQHKAMAKQTPPDWAADIDVAGLSAWVNELAAAPKTHLSDPAIAQALAQRWTDAMPHITRHLVQAAATNSDVRAYADNWLNILKHHLNKDCPATYSALTPMLDALSEAAHTHG